MRTTGALLSLLFLSSTCVGRVFAADEAAGGGGEGGDTPPQDLTRIQNQHDEEQPSRVSQGGSPKPHDHHKSTSASASSSTTTTAATASTADATCSAADGSSCSTAAAATTPTGKEQQQKQLEPGGEGAVKVATGEQDGVRIEFVGRAEGKIPEPERDAAASQMPAAAAAAPAAEMMKFELLRCDGESHRDGTEGGLTVKGVWNHLRGKLESSWEESAQWVRRACLLTVICSLFQSFSPGGGGSKLQCAVA